ncbi:alpha/beta fold hydrolase [Halomonas huangheensis]|uniref:AB hydrolase-1 domain-containing protein n=1 Tax=Halomonas huangheensis TaxID=1178482 RepID=W1NC73_9GAMM|nr:alpha/beta fold hydrolase [Halomonas huangheensis]ALM52919.1 hypothetical protein AR456_11960 [Halomonas huangheensis]ERL53162.1 hypothetical protein BJB45_17965 [Halomonas huangheensis]
MKLILLSGWGLDARIWQPLAPYWSNTTQLTSPDWPGMGQRPTLDQATEEAPIAALSSAMAEDLSADAIWVGWSLGALQATALAHHLPTPRGLVLLGMGSRFCHPQGVSEATLANFRSAFDRDPDKAWQHFLRWQLSGEPSPRSGFQTLSRLIGETLSGDRDTLAHGLECLAHNDISSVLSQISCPVRRICGDNDPLLAESVRNSMDAQLADAGHCPMISQPRALAQLIEHEAHIIDIQSQQQRHSAEEQTV